MTHMKRIVSSVLFVTGVMFVFAGMSAALGFTVVGVAASAAAIVTLLYAGGVWFAARALPRDCAIVFDRALRVTCGPSLGTPVAAQFPGTLRHEVEARCGAAIAGQSTYFSCEHHGVSVTFHAAPIRGADGTILYGVLLTGAAAAPPAVLV
jgi:hypothetical protein